jgi:hypothetical protein
MVHHQDDMHMDLRSADDNLIEHAAQLVGVRALARACGISYEALTKWRKAGRLPRTDLTGETYYATAIETATNGRIGADALLHMTRERWRFGAKRA